MRAEEAMIRQGLIRYIPDARRPWLEGKLWEMPSALFVEACALTRKTRETEGPFAPD